MAKTIVIKVPDLQEIREQTRRVLRTVLLTVARETKRAADKLGEEKKDGTNQTGGNQTKSS